MHLRILVFGDQAFRFGMRTVICLNVWTSTERENVCVCVNFMPRARNSHTHILSSCLVFICRECTIIFRMTSQTTLPLPATGMCQNSHPVLLCTRCGIKIQTQKKKLLEGHTRESFHPCTVDRTSSSPGPSGNIG